MKPAREPASSLPKTCASLKKPHESWPFAAPCGPRRKKNDRGQTSAFPSETSRFTPLILAHRGSALPSIAESGAYPPDRALPSSLRQCFAASRVPPPPEGHQIGARKGRTLLRTPSSANHTGAASQPTGRITGFGGRGHEGVATMDNNVSLPKRILIRVDN